MFPSSLAAALPRELRAFLNLANQVFEIEKKAGALTESNTLHRNVKNLRAWLSQEVVMMQGSEPVVLSFTYHNPLGEAYNETRTDCDASIAGQGTEHLRITEVIKPIVWLTMPGMPKIIMQKAIVVVESDPAGPEGPAAPLV